MPMTQISEVLAHNLKRLRAERGWTQATLAERADVHLQTIRSLETEKHWPSLDGVSKIAKAFGINEVDLFVSKEWLINTTPEQALEIIRSALKECGKI